MSKRRQFSVLVATDGSPEARAAVGATLIYPWPARTRVSGVLARRRLATFQRPQYVIEAFDRAFQDAAAAATRQLARRWSDARVIIDDQWAAASIIEHARRLRARLIVMGSRRRGMLARLALGSVSHRVIRSAPCAVLIVRSRPRELTRVVVGVDGSAHSHHAVALLASLRPRRGARVVLMRVVEPLRPPSVPLAPNSVRKVIARELAGLNAQAIRKARREFARLAPTLEHAGWTVRRLVPIGHPLPELLRVVTQTRAQLLAIGARGVGGVERLLLGSVAEGVLNRARTSVLIAR